MGIIMQSMTGFGSAQAVIKPFGKISVELRSINHKFLELSYHLPEGFISFEDKIKNELESQIKRGRITCAINFSGPKNNKIYVDEALLKNYILLLKSIKTKYKINDELGINHLIHLPGVMALEESELPKDKLWPPVKNVLGKAMKKLVSTRFKEGRALVILLKKISAEMNAEVKFIKERFKQAVKKELEKISNDEARANFLKDSDIAEELQRLEYHVGSFSAKLNKTGPIGKELDFIAQEMQRETNTLGAKSFDVLISSRVVQMKSRIEKIREQVQNIE